MTGGEPPLPVPECPLGREPPLPDPDGIGLAEPVPEPEGTPDGRPRDPERVLLRVGLEADIVPTLMVPVELEAPMGFEAEAVPKLVLGTELEADKVVLELEAFSCCGHAITVAARASGIRHAYCMVGKNRDVLFL